MSLPFLEYKDKLSLEIIVGKLQRVLEEKFLCTFYLKPVGLMPWG